MVSFLFSFVSFSSETLRALLYQHSTIVFTYIFSLIFVAALSTFFLRLYQKDAQKDSLFILLFSLILSVFFLFLLQEPNILTAAVFGVFTGECVGLVLHLRKH